MPDSWRLKLDRATEHVNALDHAIERFLDLKPYAARRVINSDGTEYVFVWEKVQRTPDCFALIAGDAIHNLRSSLDHMAVELAKAGAAASGTAMTKEEEARIQFPIVESRNEFDEQVSRRRLQHVKACAQAIIERAQPYNVVPKSPRNALVWIMGDLDNADKHRELAVAAFVPTIVQDALPSRPLGKFQFPSGDRRAKPGAEIGRFVFSAPQREVDVPVEFRWGFILWTGANTPFHDIRHTLRTYIDVVSSMILDPLAQLLP